MVHLTIAASQIHRRAMTTIIDGIVDPDSWLQKYIRRERRDQLIKSYENYLGNKSHDLVDIDAAKYLYDMNASGVDPIKVRKHKASARWIYKPNTTLYISLPEHRLPISFPIEDSESKNHVSLCEIALTLSKYLSEMSAQTNNAMKFGLAAYLSDDYYTAVSYFEEASELGITVAHDSK